MRHEPASPDPSERRFRLIVLGGGTILILIMIGTCATFAAVAPYIGIYKLQPTRIEVRLTGTVDRIAGMPLPADATLVHQTFRETGGTFDFLTRHRPQQLYDFYYFLVAQRGGWHAGSRPLIGEDSARFRFYPGTVPRLTLIDVVCDAEACRVHVDY